jgi:hypothetical protein
MQTLEANRVVPVVKPEPPPPACSPTNSGEFCSYAIPKAPAPLRMKLWKPGEAIVNQCADNVTVVMWSDAKYFYAVGYDVVNATALFSLIGSVRDRGAFLQQLDEEMAKVMACNGQPLGEGATVNIAPQGPPVGPGGMPPADLFRIAYTVGSGVLRSK